MGLMEDDAEDDYAKTPVFKIAAWIVLAFVAIGLILTLVLT
jgi:hypothetical protein